MNTKYKYRKIYGSLQTHAAKREFRGGCKIDCPTIGTTDFALPKLLIEYEP